MLLVGDVVPLCIEPHPRLVDEGRRLGTPGTRGAQGTAGHAPENLLESKERGIQIERHRVLIEVLLDGGTLIDGRNTLFSPD